MDELKRAIEHFEKNKSSYERCLKDALSYETDYSGIYNKEIRMNSLAITALRQMQPKEPCEWCAIESEIEPNCIVCVHIEEINGIGCDNCDDHSNFKPQKQFCGYCGRPLGKDVK